MNKIYFFLFTILSLSSYSQLSTHNYSFDGVNREFNLYIPTTYNASTDSLPVVFFLHGMGGDMSNFTGLSYKAEAEKFIMVIPQGIVDQLTSSTSWHSGAGLAGIYPNSGIDDVGFINSLIDSVSKWYNVNPERIYSTGFSMGGFMTNRLGCELGDRIAAIASVSGTIGNEISSTCNPENIIPALHIHSTSDQTVPFTSNNFGMDAVPLKDFWIANNNCSTTADSTVLTNVSSDGFSAVKYLYTGGDLGSEVEFYKLVGPAHNESWFTIQSGNDFDAVEVIWDFFSRHKKIKVEEPSPNPIKVITLANARLDIYPNPTTDFITLNLSAKLDIASISIANTLGKVISKKTFDGPISKVKFNVKDQYQGIYFFQIEDNDGNKSVVRFIKK